MLLDLIQLVDPMLMVEPIHIVNHVVLIDSPMPMSVIFIAH